MALNDPYNWLEDLRDPRVLEFINRKNAIFRSRFCELSSKLSGRVLKYYEVPVLVNVQGSYSGIFALFRERKGYTVYLYRNFEKTRLLDSKSLGNDVIIQWIKPSTDGRLLAYAYSRGTDVATVRLIDVEAGEEVDRLEGSINDITWINKYEYYYTRFYREGRTPDGIEAPAERVFLREAGGKEELVFGEGLPTRYMVSLERSIYSDRVFITVHYGWIRSSVYAGRLRDPSTWRLVHDPGETTVYPVEHVGGKYVLIVYDGNGLGRIISVGENGEVEEVVREDSKYPLEDAVIYRDYIIANYLVEASSALRFYDLNGKLVKEMRFDKPGNVTYLQSLGEYCLFRYVSFNIPYRLYEIRGGELRVVDEKVVGDVCVEELLIESFDKTPIHVFHVYNCCKRTNKALLTGYGGFGISHTPRFLDYMLAFVEDGGEYFVANIRGGGEYGRAWHEAGRREKRENAYGDFISVIKWLREQGYEVVIHGRSNGGLLCGVIYTRIPELIKGAIIGYPLLDMLTYHKLYIGKLWTPEYGDPDDPKDREYLLKVSPYHNLKLGVRYPPCLIYTGLNDDRVHPGHALKFSAKLEDMGVEHYLRVETASGHIGSDPEILAREGADILAFAYSILELNPE
ncbi:MAG: prolyl oligopeptidase family serine peptidase [Desulfurococcaceae archaeon]